MYPLEFDGLVRGSMRSVVLVGGGNDLGSVERVLKHGKLNLLKNILLENNHLEDLETVVEDAMGRVLCGILD